MVIIDDIKAVTHLLWFGRTREEDAVLRPALSDMEPD
jgi:hypothetical protein